MSGKLFIIFRDRPFFNWVSDDTSLPELITKEESTYRTAVQNLVECCDEDLVNKMLDDTSLHRKYDNATGGYILKFVIRRQRLMFLDLLTKILYKTSVNRNFGTKRGVFERC